MLPSKIPAPVRVKCRIWKTMRVFNVAIRSLVTLCVCLLITVSWMFLRLSGLRPVYTAKRPTNAECPITRTILDGIDHGINLKTNTSRPLYEANCTITDAEAGSITVLIWADRSLVHLSGKARYIAFQPVLTPDEYGDMMDLFAVFLSVCEKHGIQYMMYGGSLLGVRRHGGIVPWDDDIDVLMNSSQRLLFREVIKFEDGLSIQSPANHQWKVYKSDTCNSKSGFCSNTSRTWPYIDIFFFDENATHIWDNNEMYKATYCYKKSEIYPLQQGLFEGMWVRIPAQPNDALRRSYNADLCVTSIFSHKTESYTGTKQMALPCKRLFPYFPFVYYECVHGYIVEYLKMRSYVIHTVKSKVPC